MKVYVVTYQTYLYGDEYEDIERVMEGFDVKGVFSTKKKAQNFIDEYIQRFADEFYGNDENIDERDMESKKQMIEDEDPPHWSIDEVELDKQIFK